MTSERETLKTPLKTLDEDLIRRRLQEELQHTGRILSASDADSVDENRISQEPYLLVGQFGRPPIQLRWDRDRGLVVRPTLEDEWFLATSASVTVLAAVIKQLHEYLVFALPGYAEVASVEELASECVRCRTHIGRAHSATQRQGY